MFVFVAVRMGIFLKCMYATELSFSTIFYFFFSYRFFLSSVASQRFKLFCFFFGSFIQNPKTKNNTYQLLRNQNVAAKKKTRFNTPFVLVFLPALLHFKEETDFNIQFPLLLISLQGT